ncbi:hypothetical protein [Parapedobacter indicus]|uniref:Glycosyl hydrolase family 20, domain 2 n=1 Tax=Parapedobacter indicus TaxID=1477437 RepID=A0A1I3FVL9_9SPHI|nr:hypothetical protein [Parapedobacter indicus]PPL03911.1 hypothetical protein CLV26_102519 [Parapedobacter indicus]SFI15300.1 hypothetical protein SAMN05444682_102519 [Parapedobacter indicus]
MTKKYNRRRFLGDTGKGVIGTAVAATFPSFPVLPSVTPAAPDADPPSISAEQFAQEIERVLPPDKLFGYHERVRNALIHENNRNPEIQPRPGEMALPTDGWKLIIVDGSEEAFLDLAKDFQDYLEGSMGVRITVESRDSLVDWKKLTRSILLGVREHFPGLGSSLDTPKSYELLADSERIVVCGYDLSGVRQGLFNLEARMNLREAPFLPQGLHAVRNSLYQRRMALSWLGWMEWPDQQLSRLAHDGFDGLFTSVYANPNGDRNTAENSTDFYARLLKRVRKQDPSSIHDLIRRASRYGIQVFTPIIYQYTGTPDSEAGLRTLVKDIIREFPDMGGYVLLTEGFWYGKWGGLHGAPEDEVKDWARNWSRAIGIVTEECHRVNPATEVLAWEYNIDFRPQNEKLKRYFVQQLPAAAIPMLTWENGKSFELDGMKGYLRDYSLSQIGPAEVTRGQLEEVAARGMKAYAKVDTFASWQFGTQPYLPFPGQWKTRYDALEKYKISGTLESWSSGYSANFIVALRAWSCWSDAPPFEELLANYASFIFGDDQEERVLQAWHYFDEAIRLVPDTGPNMGTNHAVANPLFFQEPPARTATFNYSWTDQSQWMGYLGSNLNPYWPFTVSRMVFYPDFTNRTNQAERYAQRATGIVVPEGKLILPVFLDYLKRASHTMEQGLKLYREAALNSPERKRKRAVREVLIAEQLNRMMQSNAAVLEFENLRLKWASSNDPVRSSAILERMESLLKEEIARTRLSLLAATRDSRLGFQFEQDYVYTPYSLQQKLELLEETLHKQLAAVRK